MKYEAAILVLWLIAILATLYVLRATSLFTYLAPVYAICLIGCLFVLRQARTR